MCAPPEQPDMYTSPTPAATFFFFFAGKILFFPTLCASVSENEYWLRHGVNHLHSVNIIIKMSLQKNKKKQKREGERMYGYST